MGEADVAYLQGGRKPLTTSSSILISSSKYLNSGRMREVYAALGLQRTGHDLPEAYLVPEFGAALNELTDWPYVFRLIEDERRAKPEFAAWLDARFVSNIKVGDVAHCASGTLGAHVHAFMTGSGFTLDFAFRDPPKNDYEYFIKRGVQCHDIEHMVTGFEATPLGEYGLMIFTAVNNAAPLQRAAGARDQPPRHAVVRDRAHARRAALSARGDRDAADARPGDGHGQARASAVLCAVGGLLRLAHAPDPRRAGHRRCTAAGRLGLEQRRRFAADESSRSAARAGDIARP